MSRPERSELLLQPRWQMDCTCRAGHECDTCIAYEDVRGLSLEMADAIMAYGENPSAADPRTVAEHDEILRLAAELKEIAER